MTFRPWFAVPLACLPAMLAMPSFVALQAQQAPEVVLSDAPAFCQHLQRTLTDLASRRQAPLPPDVAQLSHEGTRLCDEGSTRAGIMRLREAMVLMSQGAQRQTTLEELPAAK
ncbi:MAG TPA: hypothetical protein VJY39_15420 [Acidisphaera sp.]|nr:hypothetical protein [Acidisphaera sp.]